MKVITLVGTRPEFIKLSRVVAELDRRATHILVHSGQNFDDELSRFMFRDLGIRKPDRFLDAAGECAGLDWTKFVETDSRYLRPTEVDHLAGDASKARARLGWKNRRRNG